MLTWAKLLSALTSLVANIVGYFRDRQLIEAGKNEAELEAKNEADKIGDAIDHARADTKLRDATRAKYLRD